MFFGIFFIQLSFLNMFYNPNKAQFKFIKNKDLCIGKNSVFFNFLDSNSAFFNHFLNKDKGLRQYISIKFEKCEIKQVLNFFC